MKRRAFLKLPDRYTGWLGEDCSRQEGRRFIKRVEHRSIRHYVRKEIREQCNAISYENIL